MRIVDTIEVKQNLTLIARERGKVVARREGHNIWLDLGREYLAKVISLQSFSPDVAFTDERIKFMGLGVGGTRQVAPAVAGSPPISTAYPGTNLQTDTDPTLTTLERPVRVSGSTSTYPGLAGDAWIAPVQAPADISVPKEVTFRRAFLENDVSYGTFASVPLSEVGLFLNSANPENYLNTIVAYDTFDTISKTAAVALEVIWTIRF